MFPLYSTVEYIGSDEGTFTFSMGLYSDAEFLNALALGESVSVGEDVYAKITLDTDANVKMFVTSCVAEPEKNSPTYWPFFEDSYVTNCI